MCAAEAADPAEVMARARAWIGTPYRHQASLKGVGADCLGLVRGVWRELQGGEPEPIPPYAPDWSECSGEERLLAACRRFLLPGDGVEGDVLLFRMAEAAPAKHLAIRATSPRFGASMIHAHSGRAVFEAPFDGGWRRRLVACFRFPRGA